MDKQNKDKLAQGVPVILRRWATFCLFVFLIWAFAFVVGPWMKNSIPTLKQIAQVVDERDIDPAAFFYTETESSYDGETYIRESIKLSAPEKSGLTGSIILGVILCFVILGLGYRFLPDD